MIGWTIAFICGTLGIIARWINLFHHGKTIGLVLFIIAGVAWFFGSFFEFLFTENSRGHW